MPGSSISRNKPCPRAKKRAYRKSTSGCGNCKLRRVKCDESKPSCKNCANFGVSCTYQRIEAELRAVAENVEPPAASLAFPCSINITIMEMINSSLRRSYVPFKESRSLYQLRIMDLEILHRFQTRTVHSITTPITRPVYQTEILRLVGQHPYLLHVAMTLTAAHDRHMHDCNDQEANALEVYHYDRAVSLLKQKLDMFITTPDKVPLWIACTLLKGVCFAHVDASCPEEAWPLNSDFSSPLDWIRLQDGVHAVLKLIGPMEPHTSANDMVRHISAIASRPLSAFMEPARIPPLMTELFEVHEFSDELTNPYHHAVHLISTLMDVDCHEDNVFQFWRFGGELRPDFRRLLFMKDPRALLLLAYWYAMVGQAMWHFERRATVECQSICIFLERYHADNLILQQLLHFPKTKCGLIPLD